MNSYSIALFISIIISLFFQTLNYKYLTDNKKIKISLKKIIQIVIIFVLLVLNNYYDTDIFKAPIGFLLIVIANRTIYKDPYNIVINTTSISYAIAVFIEIILSVVFIKLGKFDLDYLSHNELLIFAFSFLTNYISCLICCHTIIIKKFITKINNISFNSFYKKLLVVSFLIILLIVDFKNIYTPTFLSYIVSVLLVVLVFIIFISYLNDEYKINTEINKVDILLSNISNYEKIIDDNRINSHEMLNNLLLLKSYKNKNSKKFDRILDDLIVSYDRNGSFIRNISILPKGLKGIIYYKIDKMKSDISINISKQVSDDLERVNNEDYIILCKCFSILLDNAVEACFDLDNRKIHIDIYKEKTYVVLSIENTCKNNVDMEKINGKNYSTKGKNRGLGLYILNNLVNKTKNISLVQETCNGYFVSKLIVKRKKDLK